MSIYQLVGFNDHDAKTCYSPQNLSILILGSDGFIGKNLKFFFKERGLNYLEYSKKKI